MEKSPDAFRTISEVAEWLGIPAHVLRFWETRFAQVKPVKRAGGRRYYRPADMLLIGGIKRLLHDDGMTIRGVQKLLRDKGVKHVSAFSQPLALDAAPAGEMADAAAGGPAPELPLDLPEDSDALAAAAAEAILRSAPAQEAVNGAPTIPPTPDVPEEDPGDDAPVQGRAPGMVARLLEVDRTALAGVDPGRLAEFRDALRAVRDRARA